MIRILAFILLLAELENMGLTEGSQPCLSQEDLANLQMTEELFVEKVGLERSYRPTPDRQPYACGVVSFRIGEDGKAVDIEMEISLPKGRIDRAAINALRKSTFRVPVDLERRYIAAYEMKLSYYLD